MASLMVVQMQNRKSLFEDLLKLVLSLSLIFSPGVFARSVSDDRLIQDNFVIDESSSNFGALSFDKIEHSFDRLTMRLLVDEVLKALDGMRLGDIQLKTVQQIVVEKASSLGLDIKSDEFWVQFILSASQLGDVSSEQLNLIQKKMMEFSIGLENRASDMLVTFPDVKVASAGGLDLILASAVLIMIGVGLMSAFGICVGPAANVPRCRDRRASRNAAADHRRGELDEIRDFADSVRRKSRLGDLCVQQVSPHFDRVQTKVGEGLAGLCAEITLEELEGSRPLRLRMSWFRFVSYLEWVTRVHKGRFHGFRVGLAIQEVTRALPAEVMLCAETEPVDRSHRARGGAQFDSTVFPARIYATEAWIDFSEIPGCLTKYLKSL